MSVWWRNSASVMPRIWSSPVITKGDWRRVIDAIPVEMKVSGRETVGVLVDANDRPSSRWQAVQGRLRNAGVTPPATMGSRGTIIEGSPRVGVWLIPDPPKKSARAAVVGCSAVAGTMVLDESRTNNREHPFDASSEQP